MWIILSWPNRVFSFNIYFFINKDIISDRKWKYWNWTKSTSRSKVLLNRCALPAIRSFGLILWWAKIKLALHKFRYVTHIIWGRRLKFLLKNLHIAVARQANDTATTAIIRPPNTYCCVFVPNPSKQCTVSWKDCKWVKTL